MNVKFNKTEILETLENKNLTAFNSFKLSMAEQIELGNLVIVNHYPKESPIQESTVISTIQELNDWFEQFER